MIRKENVNKNLEMAQENYPEFFGQVSMLYIQMNIQGTEI
jgi:hypothetical protein